MTPPFQIDGQDVSRADFERWVTEHATSGIQVLPLPQGGWSASTVVIATGETPDEALKRVLVMRDAATHAIATVDRINAREAAAGAEDR